MFDISNLFDHNVLEGAGVKVYKVFTFYTPLLIPDFENL